MYKYFHEHMFSIFLYICCLLGKTALCVWSFGPYMAAKERVGLGALVYQEIRGSQPVLLTLRETVVAHRDFKTVSWSFFWN